MSINELQRIKQWHVAHRHDHPLEYHLWDLMLIGWVMGLIGLLPVTVLSLGLFLFVINALMFWAAAEVLDGFAVAGFAAALIGSLIYSLCGMVIDVAMERLFSRGPA